MFLCSSFHKFECAMHLFISIKFVYKTIYCRIITACLHKLCSVSTGKILIKIANFCIILLQLLTSFKLVSKNEEINGWNIYLMLSLQLKFKKYYMYLLYMCNRIIFKMLIHMVQKLKIILFILIINIVVSLYF